MSWTRIAGPGRRLRDDPTPLVDHRCLAGFGRTFAEVLLAEGDHVVATARDPEDGRRPRREVPRHRAGVAARRHRRRAGAGRRRGRRRGRTGRRPGQQRGPRPARRAARSSPTSRSTRCSASTCSAALAVTRAVLPHMRSRRQRPHRPDVVGRRASCGNPGPRDLRDLEVRAGRGVGGARRRGGAVRDPRDDRRARPVPHGVPRPLDGCRRRRSPSTRTGRSGAMRERFGDGHGRQPGDPVLAVEAIITTVRCRVGAAAAAARAAGRGAHPREADGPAGRPRRRRGPRPAARLIRNHEAGRITLGVAARFRSSPFQVSIIGRVA